MKMGINYVGDVGYANAGYKICSGGTNRHICGAGQVVDIGGLLTDLRSDQKLTAQKRCEYLYQGSGLEPAENLALYTQELLK